MSLKLRVKSRVPSGMLQAWYRMRDGTTHDQWLRAAMYSDLEGELRALGPEQLDAVEISGAQWGQLPWRSHRTLDYPDFDLCDPATELPDFDVVVCDQVLEHVVDPLTAVATLRRLVRVDGYVVVGTPFLVRLHAYPGDYWRFTPAGLELLLQSGGLRPLWVRQWGNRRAVLQNFDRWKRHRPWQSMRNEPRLPAVVWAIARPSER